MPGRFVLQSFSLFVFIVVTLVAATASAQTSVFINEIHYDNASTDEGEAVEVVGPAGTDLTNYRLVLYNGSGGAPYGSEQLIGGVLEDEGAGYGTIVVTYAPNGLQNGSPDGVALVNDVGEVVQFLSYEGSFTAVGGPADGMTSSDIGVSETTSTSVGWSLQLTGVGTVYEDFTWAAPAPSSFGSTNPEQTFGQGPPPPPTIPCLATPIAIGSVQGQGTASPLAGQVVTIEGVVVGDFEGGSPALRGFYVQDGGDGDELSSDGVFVFNADNDSVELGEVVQVTGAVSEYFDQTQLTAFSIEHCIESDLTVDPEEVVMPFVAEDELERFEGMLVHFPQTLYVTEHFQLGRFGQVVVSSGDRLAQPTQIVAPGAAALAVLEANRLNRLIIDDGENSQNPDPIVFGRGGLELAASNTLRGGDSVTGATGVLTYTWAGNAASGNAYRLRPVGALGGEVFFEPQNPRPSAPPSVGGSVQVASFNVLNYFLTLDDAGPLCGPNQDVECRGADSALELSRQRTKLLSALHKLDADVLGLVELENTAGVSPEADIVAGLNELFGAGTYAAVDAGTVGTDAIRVGLLYKPAVVEPLGDPAVLDYALDPLGRPRTRASLAQTFSEVETNETFSVVVNHFKSKGGSELDDSDGRCAVEPNYPDCDRGDGQGYFNATRTASAERLVDWLSSAPTGVQDPDWLLLGDFNSYAQEDPIAVLQAAGYVDLDQLFHGGGTQSYVFDGQWGTLDYALASATLRSQVVGAASDAINADEPAVLDYNTDFKSSNHVSLLYAGDEFRTSDHDPLMVGLKLNQRTCKPHRGRFPGKRHRHRPRRRGRR